MNTAHLVEEYLHAHIPISADMGVTVATAKDDFVRLNAPLDRNINHRDTVFGGSAVSVAILSAWALIHTRLLKENRNGRLVIRRNTMRYVQPIESDFTAECHLESSEQWERFINMVNRKGMGRLVLNARLLVGNSLVGEFSGEYVFVEQKFSKGE